MIKKGSLISERYLIMNVLIDEEEKKIYQAYHLKLGLEVIIKKINLANKTDFSTEVSVLKMIKHQYIPQIYDLISYEKDSYIVMEYIKGYQLDEKIRRAKLQSKDIIKWTKQILMALDYMHNQSMPILHCDIKPSNIIINSNDNLCLIDFNISMILNGFTLPKGFSKYFAAPEIINYFNKNEKKSKYMDIYEDSSCEETMLLGEDKDIYVQDAVKQSYRFQLNSGADNRIEKDVIDNRADIYSVGALIYYMYTGKYYSNEDGIDDMYSSGADKKIINVTKKSLNYFRDYRYKDVNEMLRDMKAFS